MLLILLIWTSAVGLLFYILIASTASFKRTILSVLYPKPPSNASEQKLPAKMLEAEGMKLISGNKVTLLESSASAKQALLFNSDSTLQGTVLGPFDNVTFRVQAMLCKGAPRLKIVVDKNIIFSNFIFATIWSEYSAKVSVGKGNHIVELAFDNSYKGNICRRSIKLDYLKFN